MNRQLIELEAIGLQGEVQHYWYLTGESAVMQFNQVNSENNGRDMALSGACHYAHYNPFPVSNFKHNSSSPSHTQLVTSLRQS
jgi:hypothetical protein